MVRSAALSSRNCPSGGKLRVRVGRRLGTVLLHAKNIPLISNQTEKALRPLDIGRAERGQENKSWWRSLQQVALGSGNQLGQQYFEVTLYFFGHQMVSSSSSHQALTFNTTV